MGFIYCYRRIWADVRQRLPARWPRMRRWDGATLIPSCHTKESLPRHSRKYQYFISCIGRVNQINWNRKISPNHREAAQPKSTSSNVNMVALEIVNNSNARLRELGPGLVALFGTSIIHTSEAALIYPSRRHKWYRRIHPQSIRPELYFPTRILRWKKHFCRREDHQRMRDPQQRWQGRIFKGRCVGTQRSGSSLQGHPRKGEEDQSTGTNAGEPELQRLWSYVSVGV